MHSDVCTTKTGLIAIYTSPQKPNYYCIIIGAYLELLFILIWRTLERAIVYLHEKFYFIFPLFLFIAINNLR